LTKPVNLTTHRTACPVKIARKISPPHGLTPSRGGEVGGAPKISNYQLQITNYKSTVPNPPEQMRPDPPISRLPSPVFPLPPRNTTASASTATVVQPRPASSNPHPPSPVSRLFQAPTVTHGHQPMSSTVTYGHLTANSKPAFRQLRSPTVTHGHLRTLKTLSYFFRRHTNHTRSQWAVTGSFRIRQHHVSRQSPVSHSALRTRTASKSKASSTSSDRRRKADKRAKTRMNSHKRA